MIVVAAKLKTLEGKGDALEKEFRKFMTKIVNESGTISYIVHRGADNSNDFFVYEKYESREALKLHMSTEHYKEFAKDIASLLDGRPAFGVYNELT